MLFAEISESRDRGANIWVLTPRGFFATQLKRFELAFSPMTRVFTIDGYAWWYTKYAPADRVLEQLEADARANGRGLWAYPEPVPPWQFRHSTKASIR